MVNNYRGRRRTEEKNRYLNSRIAKYPSHVNILQEHDSSILKAKDYEDFLVCEGWAELYKQTNLAVMARNRHRERKGMQYVTAIKLLECQIISANNGNKTPIMAVEIFLPHNKRFLILNVHFHHNTAKKAPGHSQKNIEVVDLLAEFIKRHSAHLLIGDFNQAARTMVQNLQQRLGMQINEDYVEPFFKDCICIFSLGRKPPGKPGQIWGETLKGAHPVVIRHYGYGAGRSQVALKARNQKRRIKLKAAQEKRQREEKKKPPHRAQGQKRKKKW